MANRSVLFVDDDPFMRDLGRVQLEAGGIEVVSLADPDQALSVARTRPFDLIIVDFAMPSMSGLELLAALRMQDLHARTPMLVLSAWNSDAEKAAALKLGADWLDKPAPAARLLERVVQLIDNAQFVGRGEWTQSNAS